MRVLLITVLLITTPCFAAGRSFLVIASGIGGEPVYSERFNAWSKSMLEAAETRMAIPRDRIVYLSEKLSDGVNAQSTKSALQASINALTRTAAPGDHIFLLLIGHGTARGDRFLFNLPGPDVSAEELDAMLTPHEGLRWVIVNTAPSSGPFIEALSGPNRVVVTATASAIERYHTIFPDHFVAAYAEDGADTDKNGRISVAEAFAFARREVERRYNEEGRLQSEHATLADSGGLARTAYLESDHALYAPGIPAQELERLLAERDILEQRIEFLKTEKALLDPVLYDDRLEALLVEFALLHRALRAPETTQ